MYIRIESQFVGHDNRHDLRADRERDGGDGGGRHREPRGPGARPAARAEQARGTAAPASEKDARLAQKLGQLQHLFYL
jgi:hypothetical protein